jgi:exonuclease III
LEGSEIVVLTWNVDAIHSRRAEKMALLHELDWHIAALQEVNRPMFGRLREEFSSVVGWPDVVSRARTGRPHGCALVARNGFELTECRLVPGSADESDIDRCTPFAERAIAATVELGGSRVTMCSFHAPFSANEAWRVKRKNRAYRAVSDFLANEPVAVVGLDGNLWADPIDLSSFDAGDGQSEVTAFHRRDAAHGLVDVYRKFLEDQPADLEQIRTARPNGPLAVTYKRAGSGGDRMDRIYASPSFDVRRVEHVYERAVAAGSDHGAVVANLQRTEGGER